MSADNKRKKDDKDKDKRLPLITMAISNDADVAVDMLATFHTVSNMFPDLGRQIKADLTEEQISELANSNFDRRMGRLKGNMGVQQPAQKKSEMPASMAGTPISQPEFEEYIRAQLGVFYADMTEDEVADWYLYYVLRYAMTKADNLSKVVEANKQAGKPKKTKSPKKSKSTKNNKKKE
jgi:hypothetical protein